VFMGKLDADRVDAVLTHPLHQVNCRALADLIVELHATRTFADLCTGTCFSTSTSSRSTNTRSTVFRSNSPHPGSSRWPRLTPRPSVRVDGDHDAIERRLCISVRFSST